MSDSEVPAGPGDGDDRGVGSLPTPWRRRRWVWAAAAALLALIARVIVWAAQDDLSERAGARTFVAVTQPHGGEMLLRRGGRGDEAQARELLEPALATAQELGRGRIERVARALLR